MSNTSSDNWSLYASPPSIAAAAIFVAAFAILANITLIRIFKGNRVWFWISVPPLVELAGYACRIYSIQHPQQLPIYIAATAAILIAVRLELYSSRQESFSTSVPHSAPNIRHHLLHHSPHTPRRHFSRPSSSSSRVYCSNLSRDGYDRWSSTRNRYILSLTRQNK